MPCCHVAILQTGKNTQQSPKAGALIGVFRARHSFLLRDTRRICCAMCECRPMSCECVRIACQSRYIGIGRQTRKTAQLSAGFAGVCERLARSQKLSFQSPFQYFENQRRSKCQAAYNGLDGFADHAAALSSCSAHAAQDSSKSSKRKDSAALNS